MNILFISNEYPPETGFGGIATYTQTIAEYLAQKDNQVHVICRSPENISNSTCIQGVWVHRISSGTFPVPEGFFWYPWRRLCYQLIPQSLIMLAWAREAARKAHELMQKIGLFDIVEFPEANAEGWYMRSYKGGKTIVRLHTPMSLGNSINKTFYGTVDTLLYTYLEMSTTRKAFAVTSPSHALAAILRRRWRLKKVTVIPNPLASRTVPDRISRKNQWVYIGRVEYRKGVHILLQAYAKTAAEHRPPILYLIGRPVGYWSKKVLYKKHIEELIDSLHLKENVVWIHGCTHEEVQQHLSKSSVTFAPSLWENYPYSILESMEAGCAVAAAKCGGIPEIITDNETGFLFDSSSVDSAYTVMKRLISNPEDVDRIVKNAREFSKKLHVSRIGTAMEKFYND